ncbi:hypothetical protein OAH18_01575 [bacterium]|nr:hypothetical protein [bacterium]
MEWRDEILADLPNLPDDESKSLRAEILDELGDHLQCAMNRELLKNNDPQTAKKNVIERFGDVRRIAWQMWYEAMKGKIMSQRLMLGMTAFMFLCCLGMAAATLAFYSQAQSLQDLAATQRKEAMANQQRAIEAEKLARQAAEASVEASRLLQTQLASTPKSMDWNPFKVQLVAEDGTPAPAGFKVRLSGKLYSETEDDGLQKVSSNDGIIDFGSIRPGTYELDRVQSPWGEFVNLSKGSFFKILPGTNTTRKIICPSGPRPKKSVAFKLNWPKQVPDAIDTDGSLGKLVAFARASVPARTVGKNSWSCAQTKTLAFTPNGQVFDVGFISSAQMRSYDRTRTNGPLTGYLTIHKELVGGITTFDGSQLSLSSIVLAVFDSQIFQDAERLRIVGGNPSLTTRIAEYIKGGKLSNGPYGSNDIVSSAFNLPEKTGIEPLPNGDQNSVSLNISDATINSAKRHIFILTHTGDSRSGSSSLERSLLANFYDRDLDRDQKLTHNEYWGDTKEGRASSWSPKDEEFPLAADAVIPSYKKWATERRTNLMRNRNSNQRGR